jgi:hypothetical protein
MKLTIWAIVWSLLFFLIGTIFEVIVISAAVPPSDTQAAIARGGEALGIWMFFAAIALGAGLTVAGKLPGTGKP